MVAYSCDIIEWESKFFLVFVQCLFQISSPQTEELDLKILVSSKILESILGMTLQPMHSVGLLGETCINFAELVQLGSLAARHGTLSLPTLW